MKPIFLTLSVIFAVSSLPALAAEPQAGTHRMPDGRLMEDTAMQAAASASSRTLVATVNGLVCDFCAQSIHKMLMKEPGVADATVDLSAKTVTIRLKDGATLEQARLASLLKEAGYDMTNFRSE